MKEEIKEVYNKQIGEFNTEILNILIDKYDLDIDIIAVHKQSLYFEVNEVIYKAWHNGVEYQLQKGNEQPISIANKYKCISLSYKTMAYRFYAGIIDYSTNSIDWQLMFDDGLQIANTILELDKYCTDLCKTLNVTEKYKIEDLINYYLDEDNISDYQIANYENDGGYTSYIEYIKDCLDYNIRYH